MGGKNSQVLSVENEIQIWNSVRDVVIQQQQRYETNIEEDEEILLRNSKEKFLSDNAVNCVIYRKGEKEVLRFLNKASTKFLEVLESKENASKQELEPIVVDEKYQKYVNATLEPLLKGKSLNEEETESEDD